MRRSNWASASSSAWSSFFCAGAACWKISSSLRLCSSLSASSFLYTGEFHHLGGLVLWLASAAAANRVTTKSRAHCPVETVGFMAGCPTLRPAYPVTFTARAANTYGNTADRRTVRPKAQGPRPKAQGPRPKAQGPRPKAQGPRPKAQGQGPRPKAQGPRPKAQGPRPKAQGPEARGPRPEARGPRPEA